MHGRPSGERGEQEDLVRSRRFGEDRGFDCFVAGAKVGASGRVIGVDMTPERLVKARGIVEA